MIEEPRNDANLVSIRRVLIIERQPRQDAVAGCVKLDRNGVILGPFPIPSVFYDTAEVGCDRGARSEASDPPDIA